MSEIEKLEQIEQKMVEKFDKVADSLHELTLALTENTSENKHTRERVDKQERRVDKLETRVKTLEVAQAGDDARREIWGHAQKVAIGVVVAAIIGGAMMMFYGGKGG